jgi:flagellar biogenesis protein FliO
MDTAHSEIHLVRPVTLLGRLLSSLRALFRSVHVRRRERSLRICETLPLGDKRLLAVVEFGRQRLLIAATSQSISLLDRIDLSSAAAHEKGIDLHSPFLDGTY